ncbi:MAG: hydrogenase, partial [Haliscomenobacter sp.]|nr:hydrogenase [Haliscomenobacter sp.]
MSAAVSAIREPLITGSKTYHDITEDICAPTERTPTKAWVIAFIFAVAALAFYVFTVTWTIWVGIGS